MNKLNCPHTGCNACRFKDLSYTESVSRKSEKLLFTLSGWKDKIAGFRFASGDFQQAYRVKVCLSAAYTDNRWQIGMRKRDDVLSIPQCPVHAANINTALEILRPYWPPFRDFPMVYYVQSKNLIVFVLKTNTLPSFSWLSAGLLKQLEACGIQGVMAHLHPSAGRKVFGKGALHLLYGSERACDEFGFQYGALSFSQQIAPLFQDVIRNTANFFCLRPEDAVVDLYCGTGISISAWMQQTKQCLGVELCGEAVECAGVNVPESLILRGSCGQRVPQLREWVLEKSTQRNFLFVNPPRTGLEHEVSEWILQTAFDKIAYLSCSPGTLKRDLDLLETKYRVYSIQPYDFFPFTNHTECLVLLEK